MSSNKRLRLSNPSSVTLEASASSSSIPKSFKYDVFISFRGEDTRKNFVGHLYQALEAKGIETYKDDEKIQQGERINDQLLKSIQESRFFIIVFSKTYASSSWCLDELVKIMECQKKIPEQTAYPVFFDVEPTQVRKQSGLVGEAFSKHENQEAAGKWRDAMKELADLAGWELKATANGDESKLIQIIVDAIFEKLHSTNSSTDGKLVGMETRISDVLSSLEIGTEDVRMIGIKGMGGGGKTTLARAVYDQISNHFEGISFVENVREVSQPSLSGLKMLQEQILRDVFIDRNISISGVSDGKRMMIQMMLRKKVLVVLDDVDCIGQLEVLAGEPNWFKSGSRIIITTRDEQVLLAHRVNFVHDVNLLSQEEAICLFSRNAFQKEIPIRGYEELSEQVVQYADGLPLTVKVLGSFLCGKEKLEWEDAIDRLKTIPLKETLEKLELSYVSLEDDYKEIFLDIACILKGQTKEDAIRILESCGFHARIGLKVLEQRSLINISTVGRLDMHDHIEEMGKNIVRRLHPDEPNRHSRLWIDEEIEDILANDMGTEETRCLKLKKSRVNARIIMKGLGKMKKLRYLEVIFDDGSLGSDPILDDTTQLDIPNSLKYVICIHYPFLYLPKTFQANNLVGLKMEWSRMIQLWKEGEEKILTKLRFLSLSWSNLTTFDFRITPNLERLYFRDSYNLVEFCMPTSCQKLNYLHISRSKLRTFDLGLTLNIERLSLDNCADFEELHVSVACPNLKHLDISYSKLRTFDLGLTPNLETLSLFYCADFEELHVSVACPNLKFLDLRKSSLRSLDLELIPNLEKLYLVDCYHFVELYVSVACPNLKFLNLSKSRLRSLDLELIPNLERLDLKDCHWLVEINAPVGCLNKVVYLNLSGCLRFTNFVFDSGCEPKVNWSSATLHLESRHELVEINAPFGYLKKVGYLNLSGCFRFPQFVFGGGCEPKVDCSSATLDLTGEYLDSCPLHPNSNLPKLQFGCYYDENLPSSVGNFEKLISFGLCACTDFKKFSDIICSLQGLQKLTLKCNIPELPEDLLEELCLSSTKMKHLPDSICMLKCLTSLDVRKCCLGKLPEDIGQLESLETLYLSSTEIKHLPNSICMLKHLKYLNLRNCALLKWLPEDIGLLKCLKVLDIADTGIRRLPQSIFVLKGLHITASPQLLWLYQFPSEIKTTSYSRDFPVSWLSRRRWL